ncbi:MAG: acyl-CoA reductase [Flavobacteriaceae bacterium]
MDNLQQRIRAFAELGRLFRAYTANGEYPQPQWINALDRVVTQAEHRNGWFTKEQVTYALSHWGQLLTEAQLNNWLLPYSLPQKGDMTIGLVLAGNIPLVGFHDFLSVLITGNAVLIRQSSNDAALLPVIVKFLGEIYPLFKERIQITDQKLEGFDAVIATGSNNTARYFDYYFGQWPHIIRRNRNSVAVLTGHETQGELRALGEDIFRYYGLGCRSVSKLFVPEKYDFDPFFKAIFPFASMMEHAKYANNYDYNKAVYLMSEFNILENGFLMLKEDEGYASPIATVFYSKYSSIASLRKTLERDRDKIQCIVANGFSGKEVEFGHTQSPALNVYADGADTVDFLLKTQRNSLP